MLTQSESAVSFGNSLHTEKGMKCVLILNILVAYQLWQAFLVMSSTTETDPSTANAYSNGISSPITTVDIDSTTGAEMSTEDTASKNYVDKFDTTTAGDTAVNNPEVRNITPVNETEMGSSLIPINHSEKPKTNYDLAYQVDACGVLCDGDEKRYKEYDESLCNHFSCMPCHCDDLCAVYGDCCPDEDGTVPLHLHDDRITCVGPSSSFSTNTNYYMIKGCPTTSTSVESPDEELHPVTSLQTNQTYFSEFYAFCNNDSTFVSWVNHSISRPDNDDCDAISKNDSKIENCQTIYKPTPVSVVHRTCSWYQAKESLSIIDKCNVSGTEMNVNSAVQELCHTTEYLVDLYGTVYKNIFCYHCNGGPEPYLCEINYFPNYYGDDIVSIDQLTNFVVADRNSDENSGNCTEYEWKDSMTGACRMVYCLNGRYVNGDKCVTDNHTIEDTEYSISLQFSLQKYSSLFENWNDVVHLFRDNVPKMAAKFDPLIYYFYVYSFYESNENNTVRYNTVRLKLKFRSLYNGPVSEYEDRVLSLLWDNWAFVQNLSDIVVLKPLSWDSNLVSGDMQLFTFDPLNKTCCSSTYYDDFLVLLEDIIDSFSSTPTTYISLTDSLTCPYVVLDEAEYVIEDDGGLRFPETNVTIKAGDHFKFTEDEQVCLFTLKDAYKTTPNVNVTGLIKGYLSLICTCISLVCILLTLITFFKFPSLLSLPNKNTMALAMSVFAAQATFQFGAAQTKNKIVCQIVGIVIHYLWLSVIFWMNVCCYHMFRVFVASKARKAHTSHWKSLLKYTFYVYGMSSAIVSSTIAASYAMSNGNSIGYGDMLCYINDPLVIGLAFTLPLGVIIIVNTLFFSWTIYTIHRISKVEESSSADRRNVFVYIKLSTLTGAFWILAILAEVTGVTALSFISIILNGSQGLFIFVSYILNRRVYKLWARSCGKESTTMSSQYTSSTKF